MNRRRVIIGVAVLTAALALTGCEPGFMDKQQEQFKDAPIGPRVNKPVTIIDMPDGYANVATVCVNGVRFSTTTTGDQQDKGGAARALSVIVDPTCEGAK